MALDPSIPLNVRPIQVPDPTETMGRALQLKALMQQGRIQSLQAQQAEMQIADQQKVRQAWSEAGGDLNKFYGRATELGVGPDTLTKIHQHILQTRETLAKISKDELEAMKTRSAAIRDAAQTLWAAPADRRGVLYPGMIAMLQGQGWLKAGEVPEEYPGDDWLQVHADAAKGQELEFARAEEERKKAEEGRRVAEETRKQAAESRAAALHVPAVAKATADAKLSTATAAGQAPIQPVDKMRDETARRGQNMGDARARELAAAVRDNRPPTAGERTVLGFYMRAADAARTFDEFEKEMQDKNLGEQLWYQYAPNALQSDTNQAYRAAQRAFTEARLRRESGAAIPEGEFQNDARMYFPQPGDSASTLKRKREAREQVLRSLRIGAGKAMTDIGEQPGDLPQMKKEVRPDAIVVVTPTGLEFRFQTEAAADAFIKEAQ